MKQLVLDRKFFALCISALFAAPSAIAQNAKSESLAKVATLSVSTPSSPNPASIFADGSLHLLGDAEYAKLALVFAEALPITRVSIESCAKEFADSVEFHFAPGFRSSFAEGGHHKVEGKVADPTHLVRTISLVLRHNRNVCLKSLRVYGTGSAAMTLTEANEFRVRSVDRKALDSSLLKELNEPDMSSILDRELKTGEQDENWVLRLRADRSFFLQGRSQDYRVPSVFGASGRFDLMARTRNSVKLKLNGLRYPSPGLWDGVFCDPSNACSDINPSGIKIADEIEIEKIHGSKSFMLRNRTPQKKRALPFSDLRISISTLEE